VWRCRRREWCRASSARGPQLLNHSLAAHRRCLPSRVARFTFADLCDRPLGSADYLAIAQAFHTVCVCVIGLY
jgi:predicted ATPase